MKHRRVALIVAFAILALGILAAPLEKRYRVGLLAREPGQLQSFMEGLHELGYVEGRNLVIEPKYWRDRPDQQAALAAELVALRVNAIVTATGGAALAAKKATQTIPIVMASSGDAVGQGLVASLARPGSNVMGLTAISPEVSAKRLELLKETAPKVSRVGVLHCPIGPVDAQQWAETKAAAKVLRVELLSLAIRSPDEVTGAFERATRQRAQALLIFDCSILPSPKRTVDLANKSRLLAIYPFTSYPEAGGVMAYGPNLREQARRAAYYIDRILKGAKPADLPVEQPTTFELVINMRTAKALGLTIPPSILVRADQIIE